MNKAGHRYITGRLIAGELEQYRGWILAGCIAPDFFFHTMLVGHRYEQTIEKVSAKIERLAKQGTWNAVSCWKLGYILHYVEDYFTFPHNIHFAGDLKAHCRYEKAMQQFLERGQCELPDQVGGNCRSAAELIELIDRLHAAYMQETPEIQRDCSYIQTAVSESMAFLTRCFGENRQWDGQLGFEEELLKLQMTAYHG